MHVLKQNASDSTQTLADTKLCQTMEDNHNFGNDQAMCNWTDFRVCTAQKYKYLMHRKQNRLSCLHKNICIRAPEHLQNGSFCIGHMNAFILPAFGCQLDDQ